MFTELFPLENVKLFTTMLLIHNKLKQDNMFGPQIYVQVLIFHQSYWNEYKLLFRTCKQTQDTTKNKTKPCYVSAQRN